MIELFLIIIIIFQYYSLQVNDSDSWLSFSQSNSITVVRYNFYKANMTQVFDTVLSKVGASRGEVNVRNRYIARNTPTSKTMIGTVLTNQ